MKSEPTDPWHGQRKLLAVADVQTGYHHGSISHALATLDRIGRESASFVTEIRTDSQLITRSPIVGVGEKYGGKRVNARHLHDFDALFLLPSGAGTLSDEQKEDLLAYVRDDGKGLVVGHAATVGYFDWPEFGELVGGRLAGEVHGKARILVDDPAFPGALAFGDSGFEFSEQHPILKAPFSRATCHVVLRVDPDSLGLEQRGRRDDDDFPVLWTRPYGAGRVCNVAWGHDEATWDDPRFQALVRGAIQWAMGASARNSSEPDTGSRSTRPSMS